MTNEKQEKEHSYLIKMPVYTTLETENQNGLFGMTKYSDMIDFIKSCIDNYIGSIEYNSKDKTKKIVIDKIAYMDVMVGEIPSLLLQISAYKTNIQDGYFEADEKIKISKDNKLGNENNFVMLYPRIVGFKDKATCYFLLVVYEDPNKDSGEVSRLVRLVSRSVLKLPIANIKPPKLIEELSKIKEIPSLQIEFHSVHEDENDIDVKFISFLTRNKSYKKKEYIFENIPTEIALALIKDGLSEGGEDCTQKETQINIGKVEFKIKQELDVARQIIKETAEKVFNASASVGQSDLRNIFNKDFIVEKMTEVITNYLSYGN